MGVVGASIAKGWIDSGSFKVGLKSFDPSLIAGIAASWICTIPFALALSCGIYYPSRLLIIGSFTTV